MSWSRPRAPHDTCTRRTGNFDLHQLSHHILSLTTPTHSPGLAWPTTASGGSREWPHLAESTLLSLPGTPTMAWTTADTPPTGWTMVAILPVEWSIAGSRQLAESPCSTDWELVNTA